MSDVPPALLRQPTVSDRDLAARCAAGDRAAQRELFQRVRQAVHRTLFRILGSNRELEDLLQESFVAVFKSVASFRGESSLATWCSAIATRTAWAHIARRGPKTASLDLVPELPDDLPDPDRVLAAREAARRLYAALDHLDPRLRIPFTLAEIDGRTLAEVAELTGASVVAVKTRLWRARREIERRSRKDQFLASYLADLKEARRE